MSVMCVVRRVWLAAAAVVVVMVSASPPNIGRYQTVRRRVQESRRLQAGLMATQLDQSTPTLVQVRQGTDAYLRCRVKHLGEHSVTWWRHDNVLAIDTWVQAQDPRVSALVEEVTGTWLLHLARVENNDAGPYRCQVSTRPPLTHTVTLTVLPHDHLTSPLVHPSSGIVFVLHVSYTCPSTKRSLLFLELKTKGTFLLDFRELEIVVKKRIGKLLDSNMKFRLRSIHFRLRYYHCY